MASRFTTVILALLASAAVARFRYKYNNGAKRVDAPDVMNVHISPHTHDDVGWKKTPDQYFYGSNGVAAVWVWSTAVPFTAPLHWLPYHE